jgi:hypothetical protein
MAFTHPAPDTIESDLGYRVQLLFRRMRYVEGDRSAWVEVEPFGSGGNEFLGIPGDGVPRWGLYPATIRMESSGASFTPVEEVRMVRRIMAAYESDGSRIVVVMPDRRQDTSIYFASEA